MFGVILSSMEKTILLGTPCASSFYEVMQPFGNFGWLVQLNPHHVWAEEFEEMERTAPQIKLLIIEPGEHCDDVVYHVSTYWSGTVICMA